MNSIKEKFDEFISQYPIFEYRVLDTGDIKVQSRVRTICKQECERYGSTWACPPAWFSVQIGTAFTEVTGFRGKRKGLIALSLQKITYLLCKRFVFHSCGKHLLHVHDIRYLRNAGKENCFRIAPDLLFAF